MPNFELITHIQAPIERVFDLARSIDLHAASMTDSGERAIGGVTSGLIGLDEEVTWRARHFGVWQTLTSRIIACDRPTHFADRMQRGAFQMMEHHHYFEAREGGVTMMRDTFSFRSPLGWLGRIVDALVMERYMRRLLEQRNRVLKAAAESAGGWRKYLPEAERL